MAIALKGNRLISSITRGACISLDGIYAVYGTNYNAVWQENYRCVTTKPSQFKLTHSRKRSHNFDYPLNAGLPNTVIKMAQRHNRTAHIFLTMFTKKSFKKKLLRKNSQQFWEWRLTISRELLNFFDSFFTFPHTVLLSLVRKSHERGKQKKNKKTIQRGGKGEQQGKGRPGIRLCLCLPFYIPITCTYAFAASLGSSHSWPSHFWQC